MSWCLPGQILLSVTLCLPLRQDKHLQKTNFCSLILQGCRCTCLMRHCLANAAPRHRLLCAQICNQPHSCFSRLEVELSDIYNPAHIHIHSCTVAGGGDAGEGGDAPAAGGGAPEGGDVPAPMED